MSKSKGLRLQRGIDALAYEIMAQTKKPRIELKEKIDAIRALTSWYATKNKVPLDNPEGAQIDDFRAQLGEAGKREAGRPAPAAEPDEGSDLYNEFIAKLPTATNGASGHRSGPSGQSAATVSGDRSVYTGDIGDAESDDDDADDDGDV